MSPRSWREMASSAGASRIHDDLAEPLTGRLLSKAAGLIKQGGKQTKKGECKSTRLLLVAQRLKA